MLTNNQKKLILLFVVLICVGLLIYGIVMVYKCPGDGPNCSPVNPSESTGVDIDKQTHKIQIANAGSTDIWIAYLGNVPKDIWTGGEGGGWPIYPSDYKGTKSVRTGSSGGRIMISPKSYVYFPINGQHVSGCRIWPMLGCDVNGDFCKVGGSAGDPGLEGSGYDNGNNQGFEYTVPINSKFEFTFADEKNPSPDWPLDSFNVSAVDGLDVTFTYEFLDHSTGGINEVFCSMPENACPSSEKIYLDCKSNNCSNPKIVDLSYRNKDNNYMGCKSPCSFLAKGGYNSTPEFQGQDSKFPGPAYYCCAGPAGLSPDCNAGPVPSGKWCDTVHKQCKITKSPKPEEIGKAGIYCQAYDDATGLSNIPAGPNKFKMTFTDKGYEWIKN